MMERKVFFVVSAFCGVLLYAQPTTAATSEQCALLKLTNPNIACDASTPFTRSDEANFELTKGQQSPLEFLNDHACKGAIPGCLDPKFVAAVQRFYQAGEEAGKAQGWQMPHLTDGWRSPAAQAAARARGASGVGPCGSAHNFGLAVDFNDPELTRGLSPAMKWMRANEDKFGLETIGRAEDGYLGNGKYDPAHFQIQGWNSGGVARGRCITSCSAPPSGKVQSCTGGGGPGGIVSNISNGVSDAFSRITQPLSNLFRSEPAQPPMQPTLPPTNTGVKDALDGTIPPDTNTNINTNTSSNAPAANFTTPTSRPQTAEEILQEIAVGPRPTNATTTPQHPLTDEELRFLREQQARLITDTTGGTLESPSGLQPLPVLPFAGFVPTGDLNQPASNEFLQYYVQILTRVALAIAEILRVMRGDLPADPNNPETWFTE